MKEIRRRDSRRGLSPFRFVFFLFCFFFFIVSVFWRCLVKYHGKPVVSARARSLAIIASAANISTVTASHGVGQTTINQLGGYYGREYVAVERNFRTLPDMVGGRSEYCAPLCAPSHRDEWMNEMWKLVDGIGELGGNHAFLLYVSLHSD